MGKNCAPLALALFSAVFGATQPKLKRDAGKPLLQSHLQEMPAIARRLTQSDAPSTLAAYAVPATEATLAAKVVGSRR